MKTKILFKVALMTIFGMILSVAVNAQTANLSGTVIDENGAVIPGAKISVLNKETSLKRDTETNDSGSFSILLLPPGKYSLTTEREGFAKFEVQNITLNVNDERSLKIALKTGDIRVAVQVSDDSSLINESSAVATTVDRKFVESLPLNGRSFQSLIALSPGVVVGNFGSTGGDNSVTGFSVNGQRSLSNYFTVDGVSANVGTTSNTDFGVQAGGVAPATTVSGGTQSLLSLDAMQEFTIQTSTTSAKFGRQPGGQISISSRSGTNQFHGTVFEYFRNEKLDANDWISNSKALPRAALRQNDFGGVFGGPIYKNKTLFFFSYEGLRLRLPQARIFTVFNQTFRNAAHPQVRTLLEGVPLPNGAAINANTGQYIAAWSDPQTTDAVSVRVDQIFNSMTFFGRYSETPSNSTKRGLSPATLDESIFRTQTVTVGNTWVINNQMTNDLRFNFSRSSGTGQSYVNDFGRAVPIQKTSYVPSAIDAEASALSIAFTGFASSGYSIGRRGYNVNRQINVVNDFSYVKGNHRMEFGVDYRHLFPHTEPLPYSLSLTVTNFTTGQGRYAVTSTDPVTLVFPSFSAYGQDTWKVKKNLTLNFGLRWEFVPPPHATEGPQPLTFESLDDPTKLKFAPEGTKVWKTTYNNFAPRFGISYSWRDQVGSETVIRGGFGLYYDLGFASFGSYASSLPYSRSRTVATTTIPIDPTLLTPTPLNLATTVTFLKANVLDIKLPLTYQWNASVEQSFGTNQTVTASYVGSAGRRLLRSNLFLVNLYPTQSILTVTENGAKSDYNSFQLEYQRRLSKGFQALVSYTLAKSMDTGSSDVLVSEYEGKIENSFFYGPSAFDIRHNFSSALTYQIPTFSQIRFVKAIFGNWSADTILKFQSAPPVDIVQQQSREFGTFPNHPDVVSGQPVWINDSSVPGGRRINPAAFAAVTTARVGTSTRNSVRGFSVWQVDTSLARKFNLKSIREKLNLQFRADFFNVFNHPNFAQPNSVLGTVTGAGVFTPNANFGRSSQMLNTSLGGLNAIHQVGGPRSIQFSVRVEF